MNTPRKEHGPLPDLPGNLTDTLPDGFREAAIDLVLAWAALDYFLADAVLAAFGLEEIEGRILLGTIDNRAKLTKLKTLHAMYMPNDLAHYGAMEAQMAHFALPRNLICHTLVMGGLDNDPNMVIFGPHHAVEGHVGYTFKAIHIDYIKEATAWAKGVIPVLIDLADTLRGERPQSPDADRLASPQS